MDGVNVIPKTYMQTATLNVDTKIRQGLYRFHCGCTTFVFGDGMTVGH
jgi:hypothetical protein